MAPILQKVAPIQLSDNPAIVLKPTCKEAIIVKFEERYDTDLGCIVFSFDLSTRLHDDRMVTAQFVFHGQPSAITLQCRNEDNEPYGPVLLIDIPQNKLSTSVETSMDKSGRESM
jgi:hypothetical protein